MKKLMIAVALVAMAATSQAGVYKWKIGSSALMTDGKGGGSSASTQLKGADVYVFCSQNYSQTALINAYAQNGAFDTARAIGMGTTDNDGKISSWSATVNDLGGNGTINPETGKQNPFTVANNANFNSYFAVIVGDEMFVSALSPDLTSYASPDVTSWSFSGFGGAMRNSTGNYSYEATTATDAFKGAGWYSAATPTPEPTSALLLLLGVAGLALKRRRA